MTDEISAVMDREFMGGFSSACYETECRRYGENCLRIWLETAEYATFESAQRAVGAAACAQV